MKKKVIISCFVVLVGFAVCCGISEDNGVAALPANNKKENFTVVPKTFPSIIDHTTSNKVALLKNIREFESQKQYSYAIATLKEVINNLNADDVALIINNHEQKLNKLSGMTPRRKCSCFVFPHQYRDPRIRDELSFSYKDFLQSDYQPVQTLTYYQRTILDEKVGNIPLLTKELIEETVESFEYLRDSTVILEKQLVKLSRRVSPPQDVIKKCENLKRRLGREFVDFISYSVISPRLWHVSKLTVLMNQPLGIDILQDRQRRCAREISALLAQGMHKDWLNYANSDVQRQFTYVIADIKKIFAENIVNEMEVLTTLHRSFDQSKLRGENAWLKKGIKE